MWFTFHDTQYQYQSSTQPLKFGAMDSKQGEETDGNTYTGSPSPSPVADVAYQMPEGASQRGDVSPQPNWSQQSPQPKWSQPFINQYAQNTMYQQHMQQENYQNWQMPAYGCDFAPRFGAPYPPRASDNMYPPNHQLNSMGYQQYPSWHSSSAASSGSLRSLGSLGRGDNRKKSSKRRGKEKKQPVASVEVHYHAGMTLHQIKGRVVKVAKDQDGSRFIQQRLAIANNSEIQLVLDEAMLGIEGENPQESRRNTSNYNHLLLPHMIIFVPCIWNTCLQNCITMSMGTLFCRSSSSMERMT